MWQVVRNFASIKSMSILPQRKKRLLFLSFCKKTIITHNEIRQSKTNNIVIIIVNMHTLNLCCKCGMAHRFACKKTQKTLNKNLIWALFFQWKNAAFNWILFPDYKFIEIRNIFLSTKETIFLLDASFDLIGASIWAM